MEKYTKIFMSPYGIEFLKMLKEEIINKRIVVTIFCYFAVIYKMYVYVKLSFKIRITKRVELYLNFIHIYKDIYTYMFYKSK